MPSLSVLHRLCASRSLPRLVLQPLPSRVCAAQSRAFSASYYSDDPSASPSASRATRESHLPPVCVCLVRHGISAANVDVTVYDRMPDHLIPLVRPHDDPELIKAGKAIASLGIPPQDLHVWYSPYLRTQQTMDLVLKVAYGDHPKGHLIQKRESILLREQEFGDWDNLNDANMEAENPRRYKALLQAKDAYNKFYFRYPNGESRADVVQRATLFTSKLFRGFRQYHIVFLHGVTQRAMRFSLANLPVSWFESEPNPPNGSVLIMKRNSKKDSGQRWSEQWLRWIDSGGGFGGFCAEYSKGDRRLREHQTYESSSGDSLL